MLTMEPDTIHLLELIYAQIRFLVCNFGAAPSKLVFELFPALFSAGEETVLLQSEAYNLNLDYKRVNVTKIQSINYLLQNCSLNLY
jgi:hypothetical protein